MQVRVYEPAEGEQLQAKREVWIHVLYDRGDPVIHPDQAVALAEQQTPGITTNTRLIKFLPGGAVAPDEGFWREDWFVMEKGFAQSSLITNTYNAGRSEGV